MPALAPAQAAKTLMVLGLLLPGPRHGYELHRIVVAHGSLYADFKKPTLYHLLQRLARQGAVRERAESGARGPRGERLVYELTAAGKRQFHELMRSILGSYDAGQTGLEVAAVFLPRIDAQEARELLEHRLLAVRERHAAMAAELGAVARKPSAQRIAAGYLASDHALSIMDAEIAWMGRAIRHLAAAGQAQHASRAAVGRARTAT
ncbi:MAG: PadR family transcriptional regulator [Gammaproteobacteria bacterium]|nr:PadR family transcriptional regulator [Gammaproteobacteria bacterium]